MLEDIAEHHDRIVRKLARRMKRFSLALDDLYVRERYAVTEETQRRHIEYAAYLRSLDVSELPKPP